MVNNVYVIYNNLSNRYGDVMAFPSDGFALQRLQKPLEQQGILAESELCRIGTINVETGVLTPQPPVRLSFSVSEPLPVTES